MIEAVYEEMDFMEKNLSSFVFAQKYQYANLCVKASGESLISVSFPMGGQTLHLEQMAYVLKADDYTLHVLPKDEEFIPILRLKILEQHPEFKAKVVESPYPSLKDLERKHGKTREDVSDREKTENPIKEHILVLGMPDINKDRFDLFDQAVDFIYDDVKFSIDRQCAITASIASNELQDSSEDMLKSFKDRIEESRKFNLDLCQQSYDEKKSELQEAYDYYCAHGERKLCLKPCLANNKAGDKQTHETEWDEDSDQKEPPSITHMTFE